jgi:hypothetical protein
MSDAKTIEVISIGDLGDHARDVLQRVRDSRDRSSVEIYDHPRFQRLGQCSAEPRQPPLDKQSVV